MNTGQIIKIFKALADPIRLDIYMKLGSNEACACELLEDFSISQPTLSHHMRILSEAGLVVGRREGKWVHYSVHENSLQEVRQFINSLKADGSHRDTCTCQ